MSAFEVVVNNGRHSRERKRWLSDVVTRILPDPFREFGLFGLRRVRSDDHAVPSGFIRRFDHQIADVFQNVFPIVITLTDIRLHIRQDRFFIKVVTDHLWNVSVDHLVVGNAGAWSIGQSDSSVSIRIHQPRNAQC